MLSRLAENLYWHGRYLERAEGLARLINVNAHLNLDLPGKLAPGWEPLVRITGHSHRRWAGEPPALPPIYATGPDAIYRTAAQRGMDPPDTT